VFLTRISMHVYYTVPKLDDWSVWIGRDCTFYFMLGLSVLVLAISIQNIGKKNNGERKQNLNYLWIHTSYLSISMRRQVSKVHRHL